MSINHFSTDQPQTFWFSPQQEENQPVMDDSSSSKNPHNTNPNWPAQLYHQQNQHPAAWFNLNQEDEEEAATNSEEVVVVVVEKEPMFEKTLTPSDVGKLNRLVIPKQHAEKYFPLGGGESMEKGLLLSFEDESGKFWRFRYSYWNSSQSYVLTKGWSRYVKEKKLDAGDVVFFERHRTDTDRLFIGWRRRGGGGDDVHGTSHGWSNRSGSYLGQFYAPTHHQPHCLHAVPYQPHCLHGAPAASGSVVQNQTPPSNSKKQVRLFGVNLDCEHEEPTEPFTPDGSSLSSSQDVQPHHDYSPNLPNYTDIIFSGDVNQMMNRRG